MHSICQQIWNTWQWPQGWKRCFHFNSKERQCQKMFKLMPKNVQTMPKMFKCVQITHISHTRKVKWSHSVVSDSLWSHGLLPTRLLRPRDFPGESIGVGCHFLLQEIFPTQGLNMGLRHCRQMLYHLNHQESPLIQSNLIKCSLLHATHYVSCWEMLLNGHWPDRETEGSMVVISKT